LPAHRTLWLPTAYHTAHTFSPTGAFTLPPSNTALLLRPATFGWDAFAGDACRRSAADFFAAGTACLQRSPRTHSSYLLRRAATLAVEGALRLTKSLPVRRMPPLPVREHLPQRLPSALRNTFAARSIKRCCGHAALYISWRVLLMLYTVANNSVALSRSRSILHQVRYDMGREC